MSRKMVITGHRPNKLWNDYDLITPQIGKVADKIRATIVFYEVTHGYTGGALGIDTLFALICIELGIPFTLAIPCINQEAMWPEKAQERYQEIMFNPLCTPWYVSNQPYHDGCMQFRNQWMVDQLEQGDFIMAIHDGTSGGTKNCLNYAEFRRVPMLVVNLHTLETTKNTLNEFEHGKTT